VLEAAAAAAAAANSKTRSRTHAARNGKTVNNANAGSGSGADGGKTALVSSLVLPSAKTAAAAAATAGASGYLQGDSSATNGSNVSGGSSAASASSSAAAAAAVAAARISTVRFSPSGRVIAVGMASGALELVTSLAAAVPGLTTDGDNGANGEGGALVVEPLKVFQSFAVCTGAITHVAFSKDEQWLAVADSAQYISLFRYTHQVR